MTRECCCQLADAHLPRAAAVPLHATRHYKIEYNVIPLLCDRDSRGCGSNSSSAADTAGVALSFTMARAVRG